MKVNIITLADVAKCPNRSLAPEHYRNDGTCLHNDPKPPPPPRMAIVVTLAEGRTKRRYVVAGEDAYLFENVPSGKVPEAEGTPALGPDGPGTATRPPSINDIVYAREQHVGRFYFGGQWLRSMGKVDEMYRSLSTSEVVKVERIPYDKVWGDRS